jgi:hypothetical protein
MLIDILNAVKNGGTLSLEDLSVRINLPAESIRAALEQLVRLGYLSLPRANDCAFGCAKRACAGCCISRDEYEAPKIRWYSPH